VTLREGLVASVRDLSVRFGADPRVPCVVDGLSFDVGRGETLAIVGESGSGKSVTALAMMRLVGLGGGRIASGSILLRTRTGRVLDMAREPEERLRRLRGADIAMIFQEPMTSLNPVFTVGNQVIEAIRLHQALDRAAARAEAVRIMDRVRMPDAAQVLERYPHQLSGGMRQRVMIAMALSCRPALLIADEPTTSLDVTVQAQILQLIRALQQEMEMGVVFITHDMGVVAEVAQRVLVMHRGVGVESGTAQAIFAAPSQAYTRALMAAVPRLGSMSGTDRPAHFPLLQGDGTRETAEPAAPEAPPADRQPLLRVEGMVARFDIRGGLLRRVRRRVHAVEDVSFEIRAGETLALVGESGCGKSTTARAIARLLDIQSGRIEFLGQAVTHASGAALKALRRDVQMVFQDPYASLDPRQTVGRSIMEPLVIHGIARGAEALRQARSLLERVGLPPAWASRHPHELSGGQRQRVCIARALALNPRLIVADESVSALDVSIQAQVINLMLDLQRELGIAFLFISHDIAVVERISHRVAVMYLGRIVEIGSRRQVFENAQHPYTRKLMAAVPIADPSRRGLGRELLTDEVPSPIHGVDYRPAAVSMREVEAGHFVAR
jgi:glutathione transport system ATP-binding protein